MNLRQFFRRQSDSRRRRSLARVRRASLPARPQQLEQRVLLAGNVTAQLVGTTTFLTGDSANNSFEVLVENGNVIVRGQANTTINGAAADFVLTSGALPGDVFVHSGTGNDTIVFDGVSVGQNLFINSGAGDDQIAVAENSSIRRSLFVNALEGADVVTVQDATIGRHAHINGHTGADIIGVTSTTIGRNLHVNGGLHSDDILIDETRVNNDTTILGLSGDDDVVFRNSQLVDDLTVATHSGNDLIVFDSTTVGDKSWLFTGIGHDNIRFEGTSRFFDRVRAFGGPGRDNVGAIDQAVFRRLTRRSFAAATVDPAIVDARITDAATGMIPMVEAIVASFGRELTLTVDNQTVAENAGDGSAILTVTREGDTTEALTVAFSSSNEDKLQLEQSSITIPAGQASATVLLNPQDNALEDGNFDVTITATADNHADATAVVSVTDNDGSTITISSGETQVQEDSGNVATIGAPIAVPFTVSHNGATTSDVIVGLTVSDSAELILPTSVTIPAGQSSASFEGQTVPDGDAEADVTVTITAATPGSQSGTTSIEILDNDEPRLTVTFPDGDTEVTESGPTSVVNVEVTRNTDTTSALTVDLTTDQPSGLTVPPQVTIPAGEASVSFTVEGVDETLVDGDMSAAITATASQFQSGSALIFLRDDDNAELTLQLPGGNTVSEDSGAGALEATVTRNTSDNTADLVVTVALTGDSRLSGPATVTIPGGQDSTTFSFDAIDNNIVDRPADGTATITVSATGFLSDSESATVTNDDAETIQLSPATVTVAEDGGTLTVTVSRTDQTQAETFNLSYSDTSLITGPATVDFATAVASKTVDLTIVDNASFAANNDVVITLSGTGHASVTADVSITNDEVLTVTAETTGNDFVESNAALITRADTFTLTGVTAAGATVQVDNDGDGAFDEGSTTADSSGNYMLTVPLVNDASNNGANRLQVRAVVPADGVSALSSVINVHRAVGTVVRFETNQDFNNDNTLDFFDAELLDADAPVTVSNFLSYTTDTATGTERYDNLIVQRSARTQAGGDFIIQAGRYNISGQDISEIDRDADNDNQTDTIQNEFDAANSNLRGTLSMALPANTPNGGSSEWFINVANNEFLDSALHTVFGRIIGAGMEVVDAVHAVPTFDLNALLNQFALSETPLVESPRTTLAGTVSITANSTTITGTGTQFTSLNVGDPVFIGGGSNFAVVQSIVSDTEMTIDVEATQDLSGLLLESFNTPQNDDYVVFTNIGEILDSI